MVLVTPVPCYDVEPQDVKGEDFPADVCRSPFHGIVTQLPPTESCHFRRIRTGTERILLVICRKPP